MKDTCPVCGHMLRCLEVVSQRDAREVCYSWGETIRSATDLYRYKLTYMCLAGCEITIKRESIGPNEDYEVLVQHASRSI